MPFIGKQSTSNSQITNYTTTVGSGGQTNFTVVIEGGDETHVYLNGVLLKETTDYTVSSTQVSLVSPALENDIVEIKVFRSFALVDAVKATGGTFTGDVTIPNLTLSSNVIKASDGGSTITLDTSDNVTLAGNLVIPDGGNIGSASDTDAIAIASDGGLTFSGGVDNAGTISAGTIGSSVTGFTGIKVYDNWRTTAINTTTGADAVISANLERADDAAVTLIGSPMTHSSGVFTFPMTGIYLIGFHAQYYLNNSARYIGSAIQSVISGTADNLALSYTYINRTDSDTTYSSSYCSAVIDVSDTSTHKIQFVYESSTSSTARLWGSTSYNATNFTFMRIGDT